MQDPRRRVHAYIFNSIEHIRNRRGRPDNHHLTINGAQQVDCHSVRYLVDFLREEDSHEVTHLELWDFLLLAPTVESLNVLCDFFANDTNLTKICFWGCGFGPAVPNLFAAFERNQSVTSFTLRSFFGLPSIELCACLSRILQNNTTLQQLHCEGSDLRDGETLEALKPGLRVNRQLKTLRLSECHIENVGISHIADALVGNPVMEVLELCGNDLSSSALASISRLVEFTQLKEIRVLGHNGLFSQRNAMQAFIPVLQRNTSLEDLPGFNCNRFPPVPGTAATVNGLLARNRGMRRADLLLALQPRTRLPIRSKSGVWCGAMAKLASPDGFGASAIFKIFQKRPALLERQLMAPPAQPRQQAAVEQQQDAATPEDGSNSNASERRKRARLL